MTLKVNSIAAWTVFSVSLFFYLLTAAPTISFWDSAEFITCASIMGIPHPPGAPLLSLLGRVMSIVPFYDFRGGGLTHIAYRINLINIFAGAFTVMLLYLIIVRLLTRVRPFEGRLGHDWIIMLSAMAAAFMAAFSHQFWENAIETETYMPSLFLSMLAVWLTLKWEERKEDPRSVRYLFLAAYLTGLGNGIHLYVMLIVPTVFLIVLFAKPSWFAEVRLWLGFAAVIAGLAVIKYFGGRQVFYFFMAFLALSGPVLLVRFYRSEVRQWKITFLGMLLCLSLFVIGYSVYPTIIIRASKKPAINEGNPDNWSRYRDYIERRQYGQENMYTGMFTRKADMGYQFGFMYLRYLLMQFPRWGPSPRVTFTNDRSADYPGRIVPVLSDVYIPVFLWAILLFGIYTHVRRDASHFGAFFLYFLATSIGLVLYLNMQNPEARDRDYFFLGSFYIIIIWVGFGVYGVLSKLRDTLNKRKLTGMTAPVTVVTTVVLSSMVPAAVLSKHIDPGYTNFQVHNRSQNVFPLEYGLNILTSCEKDAILFTHGDNDTYPVWYAQEVSGVRRDVRAVNLSLLKAPWYIKQLRDEGVTIPITLTDDFIDNILCGNTLKAQRTLEWSTGPRKVSMAGLTWEMPPAYLIPTADGGSAGFLSVSSFMTAHIIKSVNWTRPIYFTVSVAPAALIGLDKFMSTEGMVFRLTKEEAEGMYNINAPVLERNIFNEYSYSGVTDPAVYKSPETAKLLQNYFVGFADLSTIYLELGDTENALRVAQAAFERSRPDLARRLMFYTILRDDGLGEKIEPMYDTEIMRLPLDDMEASIAVGARFLEYSLNGAAVRIFEKIVESYPRSEFAWKGFAASLYRAERYSEALEALDSLLTIVPGDVEALRLRGIIKDGL